MNRKGIGGRKKTPAGLYAAVLGVDKRLVDKIGLERLQSMTPEARNVILGKKSAGVVLSREAA